MAYIALKEGDVDAGGASVADGVIEGFGGAFVERGGEGFSGRGGAFDAEHDFAVKAGAGVRQEAVQDGAEAEPGDRVGMHLMGQRPDLGEGVFEGFLNGGDGGGQIGLGVAVVQDNEIEFEAGGGQHLSDLVVENVGDALALAAPGLAECGKRG